jgi:hypothetical protein
VDPRGTIFLNSFDNLFHRWEKISKRLLRGPDLFHTLSPLPRFPEYHMMIPMVDVLLRPLLDLDAGFGADDEEGDAADEDDQDAGAGEGQGGAAEEEGQEAGSGSGDSDDEEGM